MNKIHNRYSNPRTLQKRRIRERYQTMTQATTPTTTIDTMRGELQKLRGERTKLVSACYKADKKGDCAKLAELDPKRCKLIAAVDALQAELSRCEKGLVA